MKTIILICLLGTLVSCTSHSTKTSNNNNKQLQSSLKEKIQAVDFYHHPSYGEVALPNTHYLDTQMYCERAGYRDGVLIGKEQHTDPQSIEQYREDYVEWKVNAFLSFIKAKANNSRTEYDVVLPEKFQAAQELDDNIKQCIVAQGWVKTRTETVEKPSASTPSSLNHMVEQLLLQKY